MGAAKINMESVLSKVNNFLGSSEGQKKQNNAVDKAILLGKVQFSGGSSLSPEEAADKFIDVLHQEIVSSLSSNAAEAIDELEHTQPQKVNEGTYEIEVNFTGWLSRQSLDPMTFPEGISNLAALLNNGVDHTMHAIYGVWHGHETWSRTVIPGAHFIESAINNFMTTYASDYGVTKITVGDAFK